MGTLYICLSNERTDLDAIRHWWMYHKHLCGDIKFDFYRFSIINPYPTAFPYGNGMVLHLYQQQESSTTKTIHKVINKGLKTYV